MKKYNMRLSLENIKAEFDFDKMSEIIGANEKYFDQYGEVIQTSIGPIVFKDNGAKIIAVAHIDTVQKPRFNGVFYTDRIGNGTKDPNTFEPIKNTKITPIKYGKRKLKKAPYMHKDDARPCIAASGLDDRLGVYIILELLPQIGVKCDYILTTNEERGNSTARMFQTEIADRFGKKYNWMVEFDRRGRDCVTYRYQDVKFIADLKEAGFEMGIGSYTDICDMYKHGRCGFNVGVGYHRAHSQDSWFSIDALFVNLANFKNFYDKNLDTEYKVDVKSWYERQAWKQPYQSDWYGEQQYQSQFSGPYYAHFECTNCGLKHKNITKGRLFECKCGTEFWRTQHDGNIMRKITSGGWVTAVNVKELTNKPKQKVIWDECDMCSTLYEKGDKEAVITDRNEHICRVCKMGMYSQCEWCESWFFSLGQKSLNLCEECNEINIKYSSNNPAA